MRRLVSLVTINLLLTIGLIASVEVASRLLCPTEIPDPLIGNKRKDWEHTRIHDRLLFWRLRPNVSIVGARTNNLGLRGPQIPLKRLDELRILSLGESTTFGPPDTAPYSARLQELLAQAATKPIRVINAGVPGYTLLQGFVYLKHFGLELRPDAVLLYFGHNDFLPIAHRVKRNVDTRHSTAALTDLEIYEKRRSLRERIGFHLMTHSNIYRLLLFGTKSQEKLVSTINTGPRVPEQHRRQLLESVRVICEEHGIQLIVIIPWYLQFEKHIDLLREFTTEHGLITIDLPSKLAELPKPRHEYFSDRVHPNAEGHAVMAHAIAEEMIRAWEH